MFRTKILTRSLFSILFLFSGNSVACPFDEAGIEVTILAHNEISQAVAAGNYDQASQKIIERKYLYEYFENNSKEALYQPLLDASISKNKVKVMELLDRSLVLEIQELLDQVNEMFEKYQASRLRLIKAKKHLQVLTSDKKPMKIMKKILDSLGNPGLMGIGQRDSNKVQFLENKKVLLKLIAQI